MYTITELGLIDNHVQIQSLHVTVQNSHMQPLYLYMIVQTPEIANSMTFSVRRSGPVRFFASKMGNRQPQPVA